MRDRKVIESEWKSGAKDSLKCMIEFLADIRDLLLEDSKKYSIDKLKVVEPIEKVVKKKVTKRNKK